MAAMVTAKLGFFLRTFFLGNVQESLFRQVCWPSLGFGVSGVGLKFRVVVQPEARFQRLVPVAAAAVFLLGSGTKAPERSSPIAAGLASDGVCRNVLCKCLREHAWSPRSH